MEGEKTFWTRARRRLIAKTLANLFLLLIGASATGEVIVGLRGWLKVAITVAILASGALAVVITPDEEVKGEA